MHFPIYQHSNRLTKNSILWPFSINLDTIRYCTLGRLGYFYFAKIYHRLIVFASQKEYYRLLLLNWISIRRYFSTHLFYPFFWELKKLLKKIFFLNIFLFYRMVFYGELIKSLFHFFFIWVFIYTQNVIIWFLLASIYGFLHNDSSNFC